MKATEQHQLEPEVELSVLILHYFEVMDRIEGSNSKASGWLEAAQIRSKIEQLIKGKE